MLEIILIVVLAKKLRSMAQAKGRSSGWAALGPVLWIGGEITGAVVGASVGMDELALYAGALVGAAIGAAIAFMIVGALSANEELAFDAGVDGRIAGGNYDPSNPYNAPGANPYAAAPPPSNPDSPFQR